MSNVSKERGRPREFDEQQALTIIAHLFRVKGYGATSLVDIAKATGLTRSSLYAAFGDKIAIYLKASAQFTDSAKQAFGPALQDQQRLVDVLTDFYEAMLGLYFSHDQQALGCLIFGTAPSAASEQSIQQMLRSNLNTIDQALHQALASRAPAQPPERIQTAVLLASNTLLSLSVRAKAGVSRQQLSALCQHSAEAIAELLGESSATH